MGGIRCTKGEGKGVPKNPAAQEVKGVAAPLASTWLLRQLLSVASWACVGISVLAIRHLAGDLVDAEAVFPRTSAQPTARYSVHFGRLTASHVQIISLWRPYLPSRCRVPSVFQRMTKGPTSLPGLGPHDAGHVQSGMSCPCQLEGR